MKFRRLVITKVDKHLFWPTETDFTEEITMSKNAHPYEEGVLKTSDPMRAAALLSFGIRLIDASPTKDRRLLLFSFDDSNDAARLASACFLQDRQVGIQTFVNNLRKIRELIFQAKSAGETL